MPKAKVQNKPAFPKSYWVFGADFSLKRPGFCRLHVEKRGEETIITDVNVTSVDNKTVKKPHGELLDEIFYAMGAFKPNTYVDNEYTEPIYYVREHAFNARGAMSEIGIFEVVGLSNFWAWQHGKCEWYEVYPVSVKKLVTGNGKAQKSEVANAVKMYLGNVEFKNDDESDAAAVAVSWLLQCEQLKNKLTSAKEQAAEQQQNKDK
jgi:Holliday junction resolvasome RuvABC endonuclease subunit